MTFENITIHQATSEKLKVLDEAITDFNITVAKELPRAIIKRLDFIIVDTVIKRWGRIDILVNNAEITHGSAA